MKTYMCDVEYKLGWESLSEKEKFMRPYQGNILPGWKALYC